MTGLATRFPNAVICDLKLGTESGMEFLTWLGTSREFKRLPAVVLSGAGTPVDFANARSLGAVDVLSKPVDFDDLKAMLADLAAKLCG